MNKFSAESFVRIEKLFIEFPIFHSSNRSLKKIMFSRASKLVKTRKARKQRTGAELATNAHQELIVKALQNVSLTFHTGDRIGLIGHNGSGKSTLLRAITGIYEPNFGKITVQGTIEALLNVNSGMNPLLTGRQNIVLHGKKLGYSKEKIKLLEKDVEHFAELNEFLELPLKTYSSGMLMRLSFGLATSVVPNILLMDEWFMAGDNNFQEKARKRLVNIVNNADIVVITTHSLPILQKWCKRIVWLQAGKVIADGPTDEIIARYTTHMKGEADASD